MNDIIATINKHSFHVGDVVEVHTFDNRKWKRLWNFITFQKPPIKKERGKIVSVTENTATIEEVK